MTSFAARRTASGSKLLGGLAGTAMSVLTLSAAQAGTVTTDGPDLVINTKGGGVSVATVDGDYSFKFGGRVMLDYNSYDGVINTAEGETGSDLFFRRARLEFKGKAKDWSYLFSYNMTDSGSIDQVHVSYNGWGKMAVLQMGQQKENFGLDDTGSSKWTSGIERAMASDAFDTGHSLGIKLRGSNDALSYSVGVYKEAIDADDNSLDSAITGRIAYRPVQNDGLLVHLGAGFSLRDGEFDSLDARLGVRGGEDKTANKVRARYAGTAGDEQQAMNLEAAAVMGPAHVQFEYFSAEVSGAAAPDLEADGFYLQAGYVLTGEQRSYKTADAVFDKIKPSSPGGAWEVFARYDSFDVSDTQADAAINISGGDARVYTLGANWYYTGNVKLALNYLRAETDLPIDGHDDGDAFVARLQYQF